MATQVSMTFLIEDETTPAQAIEQISQNIKTIKKCISKGDKVELADFNAYSYSEVEYEEDPE